MKSRAATADGHGTLMITQNTQSPTRRTSMFFGILRAFYQLPCLADNAQQPDDGKGVYNVAMVDWFKLPNKKKAMHKELNVPRVLASFMTLDDLGKYECGGFWDIAMIVPVHITLMPDIDRSNRVNDNQLLVLSRDAMLLQLAHPAWAPKPSSTQTNDSNIFEPVSRMAAQDNVVSADLPCQVCRSSDDDAKMLICDRCEKGWHTYCLSPSLTEVPEGNWYCWTCQSSNQSKKRAR
jgi:PHD-finger